MTKQEEREFIKKHFVNPFDVGDILHHSWGYDQTQCDYYQVVAKTRAGVTVRPIGSETVAGSQGHMSRSAMPVKDKFVEGYCALTRYAGSITEIKKRVMAYIKDDESLRYYIPTPHGWCDKWDGGAKYNSWYA